MNNIIEIKNLTKDYDNINVLNNISLNIKQGDFIGLLGSNGAGKTTLLKLICGLLKPTEGNIKILNYSPWDKRDKILNNIGIMIETPVFYENLSVYENISIHLEYLDIKTNIDEILKTVGLLNVKDKCVSKLSMGMRQKLAIARAISHSPKILLLDEPINGLDPVAIKDMRQLFISLKNKGITIILSSHILGEIIQTVDNIVVISNNTTKELGSIKEIEKKYKDNTENFLIECMRG